MPDRVWVRTWTFPKVVLSRGICLLRVEITRSLHRCVVCTKSKGGGGEYLFRKLLPLLFEVQVDLSQPWGADVNMWSRHLWNNVKESCWDTEILYEQVLSILFVTCNERKRHSFWGTESVDKSWPHFFFTLFSSMLCWLYYLFLIIRFLLYIFCQPSY